MSSTQTNIDFTKLPSKLNLGCGFDKRPGYTNIDLSEMHNPDVVADVLDLSFLPQNHYTEIIAQDILEHLSRTSTKRALLHWAALLQHKGTLHLRVPNILGVAKMLSSPKNQAVEKQESIIQNLFGTQAYTGDFHFTTFTAVVLKSYLNQCGFSVVDFKERDEWLFDVSAIKEREVNPREVDDFSDLLLGNLQNRDFIQKCYRQVLEREVDSEGLNFYLEEMDHHRISQEQMLSTLISSEERKKLLNQ